MLSPASPVTALPGIGPAKAKALSRLQIETVEQLLYHIPRGYEDRGHIVRLIDAMVGMNASFLLTVATSPSTARLRGGLSVTKFRAFDESGTMELVYFNQDYLKQVFTPGDRFRFTGKLQITRGSVQMTGAKYEKLTAEPLPDLIPVYRLSEGLTRPVLQKAISVALRETLPFLPDLLPEDIRQKHHLPTLQTALLSLHLPQDRTAIKQALRRLAFDEFFLFALGMQLSRSQNCLVKASAVTPPDRKSFLAALPYTPTAAQLRVWDDVEADMQKKHPMSRIIVGDVGCGKTVCAAYAVYIALCAGHQAAIMAPTEILASQHFKELAPLFDRFGFHTVLLLGSTPAKEKKNILSGLKDGTIDLVIGTHALISDSVEFADLALSVTDEQHRFGVSQRAALRQKCPEAHLLVMSATPIPRTLALILYGDLDVSRIDELPPGRQKVETFLVDESYRTRLYAFIDKQVKLGGQVYIVCPAIEPQAAEPEEEAPMLPLSSLFSAEKADAPPDIKNVTDTVEDIRRALPHLRTETLTGKMRPGEKEQVMAAFAAGQIDVLVCTTVVEVGVNVPNACLMMVESAERFGLAQLHQLRGRVGRGKRQSYCVLISSAKGKAARSRLTTMCKTHDGYAVAEADLKLRGPGDFLVASETDSVRQSGGLSFRFAPLCPEEYLSAIAAGEAATLLERTQLLTAKDTEKLRQAVLDHFAQRSGCIS